MKKSLRVSSPAVNDLRATSRVASPRAFVAMRQQFAGFRVDLRVRGERDALQFAAEVEAAPRCQRIRSSSCGRPSSFSANNRPA
jgi:hypothetical protein